MNLITTRFGDSISKYLNNLGRSKGSFIRDCVYNGKTHLTSLPVVETGESIPGLDVTCLVLNGDHWQKYEPIKNEPASVND